MLRLLTLPEATRYLLTFCNKAPRRDFLELNFNVNAARERLAPRLLTANRTLLPSGSSTITKNSEDLRGRIGLALLFVSCTAMINTDGSALEQRYRRVMIYRGTSSLVLKMQFMNSAHVESAAMAGRIGSGERFAPATGQHLLGLRKMWMSARLEHCRSQSGNGKGSSGATTCPPLSYLPDATTP